MKRFEDLEFKENVLGGSRAELKFDNNYGISVINGYGTYSDTHTFEVAVLYNRDLCYTTDITNDVLSYQTIENINEIMLKLQEL